jgi:hypothetical protein
MNSTSQRSNIKFAFYENLPGYITWKRIEKYISIKELIRKGRTNEGELEPLRTVQGKK